MFDAVNSALYQERAKKFGVGTMPAEEDETQNVSIESPVTHNYFPTPGLPVWVKAALALAGIATSGGLGWLALDKLLPAKPAKPISQTLDPGGLGIEVVNP
jgi:hypothetical protein